jgi:RecA-family ATPase
MSRLTRLESFCAGPRSDAATILASEWLAQPDEKETPVLDHVFDQGDRVAIVAQSKARKSFFALQLAICAATGTSFLGRHLEPQNVLVCNGEIKRTHYKNRIRQILAGLHLPPELLTQLTVMNLREQIGSETRLDDLLTTCVEKDITFCLIDPMYLFVGDEIDQTEVKTRLAELKRFSAVGITTVSVYHATKGLIGDKQVIDRIAGSGIFARDADAMISLALHENKQDVVMSHAIRNYSAPEDKTISFAEGVFVDSELPPAEFNSRSRPKREFDLESIARTVTHEMTYEETWSAIQTEHHVGQNAAKVLLTHCYAKGFLRKRIEGRLKYYTCTLAPDTTLARRELVTV